MTPAEIKLTVKEKRTLKKISRSSVHLTQDSSEKYAYLFGLGLVAETIDDKYPGIRINGSDFNNAIQITTLGKQVLLHRKANFWKELRAWITLAIAILAFALSVISTIVNIRQDSQFEQLERQPNTQTLSTL